MANRAGIKRRKRPKLTSGKRSSAPAVKYVALNDRLYDYVVRHRSRATDPLLDELRAETEALGDIARMLISREQGDFLTMLTRLLDVHTAVEVGTLTGYSSICIARGLARNGRLTCFDTSAEWTGIARRYWARESVSEKIELRLVMPRSSFRGGSRANRSTSHLSMPTNRAMTLTSSFSYRG